MDEDLAYWQRLADALDLEVRGWTYRLRATLGTKDGHLTVSIDGWLADRILVIEDDRQRLYEDAAGESL